MVKEREEIGRKARNKTLEWDGGFAIRLPLELIVHEILMRTPGRACVYILYNAGSLIIFWVAGIQKEIFKLTHAVFSITEGYKSGGDVRGACGRDTVMVMMMVVGLVGERKGKKAQG